jgi:hypothetical protein
MITYWIVALIVYEASVCAYPMFKNVLETEEFEA